MKVEVPERFGVVAPLDDWHLKHDFSMKVKMLLALYYKAGKVNCFQLSGHIPSVPKPAVILACEWMQIPTRRYHRAPKVTPQKIHTQ